MKSYKHLVEYALSDTCINAAFKKAIKGKDKRPEVREIIEHYDECKAHIRNMILTKNYPHITHNSMIIKQEISGKERIITPPYFTKEIPEQWLHHILINTIKHILLKGAYFHSHASIPTKGVHSAKKYTARYIKRHQKQARYFLRLDIKKFYENVDTDLLKAKLKRKIRDPYIIALINWVINSNQIKLPDGSIEKKGLLIGFYCSQFFANFFLQDLDHFIKEKLHAPWYVRYMDDMLIFHSNKRKLYRIRDEIIEFLRDEHLTLKKIPQVQDFSKTPCSIIGFKFYKDRTTLRFSLLRQASRKARRIKRLADKHKGQILPEDALSIVSYIGWFKATDTKGAFQKYISPFVNMRKCRRIIGQYFAKKMRTGFPAAFQ